MPSRRFWIIAGVLVAGAGAPAVAASAYRGHHGHGGYHGDHGAIHEGRSWWQRGPISKDEFDARTRSRFARMDANSDGVVDAGEAKALIERRMERRKRRWQRHGKQFGQRMIRRFDVDRDGKVTRAEFDARVKERFARGDLDGDGQITDADLPPMMRDRGVLSGDGPIGRRGHRRGARMLRFLRGADSNGDGAISLDEANAAAGKRFARFDRNGDGTVDASDLEKLKSEIVDYRARRFLHRFGAAKDGKLSQDQFAKFRSERFARLDLNNDGELSRDELPGRYKRMMKRWRKWHGDGHHGPRHQGGPDERRL